MGGPNLLSEQGIEASTPAVHHGYVHVWQVRGAAVALTRREVSTIDTIGTKSPLLITLAPCPETISCLFSFFFVFLFFSGSRVGAFPMFPVDPINRSVLERWVHG